MRNSPLLIAILLLLSCGLSNAQSKREIEPTIPTLGGHRFINSKLVHGPWSNTSFIFYFGYGESSRLPLSQVQLGDTILSSANGSLALATLGIDYEQHIKEWLSFYIQVNGSARLGLDTRGLLTQGLNTYYGYEVGWKFRLWQNERNRLSGRVGIYNYEANFINVYQYVADLLANAPNPSVSKDIPALQTMFGVMYARSFGPLVGLQVEATGGFGDTFVRDDNSTDFSYEFAGAVDLNLYPKTNVPLGLSIGVGVSSLPDLALRNTGGVGIFNYKIVFTGTPDFLLSLDFTTFNLPIVFGIDERVGRVKTDNLSLSVIYYFN